MPTATFPEIFNGLLSRLSLWNVHTKFDLHSFTHCQPTVALPNGFISIGVLGRGCKPPIQERRGHRGVGNDTVRKSIGEFLQALNSKFSFIFTHFRDIATFVLQHATFLTLPLVTRKFPHTLLGVGGWPTKSEGVGLIVHAVSFQDFQQMWS